MSRRDLPEVRQRRGSAKPLPNKCGGRLALTAPPRYCTQHPLRGRTRCKFHGGRARRGVEHPAWKTGAYSGVLPRHLAETYEAALADDQLLSLRQEIALLRALAIQSVERASRRCYEGADWTDFKETVIKLDRLVRSETLRNEALGNVISAEAALALRHAETTVFLDALNELIIDSELRTSIRRRVAAGLAEITTPSTTYARTLPASPSGSDTDG